MFYGNEVAYKGDIQEGNILTSWVEFQNARNTSETGLPGSGVYTYESYTLACQVSKVKGELVYATGISCGENKYDTVPLKKLEQEDGGC